MKTLEISKNSTVTMNTNSILLDKQGQVPDLNIEEQVYRFETGQTVLTLYSSLFDAENHKLIVKGNRLQIIISEHIEFNKPVYMHHYSWQSYSQQTYDRLHSASILLPADNYYLVGHVFDSASNSLNIILANSSVN